MKFVIEALGLTAGGGKAGLMRLLPSLAEQGGRHTFAAVVADLPEFAALARPNLKLIVRKKPDSLLRRHFFLQRTVPRLCAAERADALLCMGNFGPRRSAVPALVMLHNACYVTGIAASRRATARERLIAAYARRYLGRLPHGTRLAVQTELMKQRVVTTLGVPATQVVIVPDGEALPAESETADACATAGPADRHAARRSPFTFLCLARYYPHKNLEALVDAMKLLNAREPGRARCLLTIAGDQHPGARRLLRRIATENSGHAVVNLGPLVGQEVAAAYRSADAFILPSRLESFGRTYLEAMRFGLPILTSDRDFARQMCGGAAVYFDPLDPGSVAATMALVKDNAALRERLSSEGRRRAALAPSWSEIGARLVIELERTAAGGPAQPRIGRGFAAEAAPFGCVPAGDL